MRKLAKLCTTDESALRFAIVSGLKPYISVHVMHAKPDTINKLLDVARIAEQTMPKAMLVTMDTTLSQQLTDMQIEMRRLSSKVDEALVSQIRSRTLTPVRCVQFRRPASPRPSPSADDYSGRRAMGCQLAKGRFRPSTMQKPVYNQQQPAIAPRLEQQRQPLQSNGPCSRCARHHIGNSFCPARDSNKVCYFCNKAGHFKAACFTAHRQY